MTPLFRKLGLKDQITIHVLDAPDSFAIETAGLTGRLVVRSLDAGSPAEFVLAFARSQTAVDAIGKAVTVGTRDDAIVWIAYPKSTSRRYRCDFNRDTGWSELGRAGFEPVRQVAIDEDWSALRFRRVEFIRTFTRSQAMAISQEGKRRAGR